MLICCWAVTPTACACWDCLLLDPLAAQLGLAPPSTGEGQSGTCSPAQLPCELPGRPCQKGPLQLCANPAFIIALKHLSDPHRIRKWKKKKEFWKLLLLSSHSKQNLANISSLHKVLVCGIHRITHSANKLCFANVNPFYVFWGFAPSEKQLS